MVEPPIEFLKDCSERTLRSFEVARLNRAANLRKEGLELFEAMLEAMAEALLARWLIEHKEQLIIGPLEEDADLAQIRRA